MRELEFTGAIEIPRHWSSTFLSNKSLAEVHMYLKEDKSFLTHFTPRPGAEGPKAHAHGGFLATILDETMGYACWLNGLPVLAANLMVKYRKSVPLHGSYTCAARINRLESRRAQVNARIYRDEQTYCEATGVFVRVPIELLKQQPDMARMVEVVESIKAGRSLADYIAFDHQRSENRDLNKSWQNLLQSGQTFMRDAFAFGSEIVAALSPQRY